MLSVGQVVRNTLAGTAVPIGTLGMVVEGPCTSYGVTVRWDGYGFFSAYGEKGWTPYWSVDELEVVEY